MSGHTDSSAYASGDRGYSNWELSADRGNAARRALIAGGMDEGRLLRVVGTGAAAPYDKKNPLNPMNRRISLIVLKEKSAESITGTVDVREAQRAGEQV